MKGLSDTFFDEKMQEDTWVSKFISIK